MMMISSDIIEAVSAVRRPRASELRLGASHVRPTT